MALDADQVWKKVYSASEQALKAKDLGAAAAHADTNLSATQIIKRVYNAATAELKVVRV